MIEGLKPYPAYNDSGASWLPRIPADWEMQRNGRLFALRKETGCPDLPILEVSLKTGVRVRNFEATDRKQVMSDRAGYQRAWQGDIAYNMMRMWQGAVGVAPVDGLVSPAYVVAAPYEGTEAAYYARVFRTDDYMREIDNYSRGIVRDRNRLYWDGFKQIRSPRPPEATQQSIVRFLDHADRLIRRYIRAKKKLIALLNEQKQAIIHQAVTRGLDPNVKLKPSGVEWLGDVPEHWQVQQVRSIAQVVRGSTPRPAGSTLYFHGDAEPWMTVGELTKDSHIHITCTTSQLTTLGVERSRIIPPDTLLLTNSGATLGVPKITAIQGCINDGVAAFLRVRPSILKEYFYYYWKTQTIHLRAWVNLGAQPNLNTQIIGGWPIVLPPLSEQRAIITSIEDQTRKIDRSTDFLLELIASIGEIRTRLIADVVTGKLDVREAAARLPEEMEEPEPTEEADDPADLDESLEDGDTEDAESEATA